MNIYKASQPRGRASGSRAYGRQEMQGVIFKCTRHECSVFVNLRPLLLRIRSRHQFSSPEKNRLPLRDSNPRSSGSGVKELLQTCKNTHTCNITFFKCTVVPHACTHNSLYSCNSISIVMEDVEYYALLMVMC